MSNKELWLSVCKTDPAHVKPISGKDYGGNSPKPYWIVERATETFGPCGIGWGIEVISERFERLSDNDVLHIAHVAVWYEYQGIRGRIEQMGQTKAVYMTSKGTLKVDEDAPKKSVTDGMVKALSYIGFAGDIFSGRWDDSKYVADVAAEYKAKNAPQQASDTGAVKLSDDEYKALVLKYKDSIHAITSGIENYWIADGADADAASGFLSLAAEAWFTLSDDVKAALWKSTKSGGCFTTKQRETIKSSEFRIAYYGEAK